MPNPLLITESTLTDRYQTTVPDAVRKALQLEKRAKIRYTIQNDGSVLLSKSDDVISDPSLQPFLALLAKDIQDNPHHLTAVSPEWVRHIQSLVGDLEIDLDAPIEDDDEKDS